MCIHSKIIHSPIGYLFAPVLNQCFRATLEGSLKKLVSLLIRLQIKVQFIVLLAIISVWKMIDAGEQIAEIVEILDRKRTIEAQLLHELLVLDDHTRDAILVANGEGGTVSVISVYGGFIDKFPMGSFMNRSLTMRTGQCHVQRYMKPLLQRIENGEIDPSFVITHRLTLDDAAQGYETFVNKADECIKVVLKP